jgi:predicted nucleotidyltransferase
MTRKERLQQHLDLSRAMVSSSCSRNGIARLAFFGSVTREDFDGASDVDVLVELDPRQIPGLIAFAQVEIELASIIGRAVDLNTVGLSIHASARTS